MKQNVPHFKAYIASGYHKKKKLNEDELTQIYIEQAQILIRQQDYPFNISSQYRDIYNLSKGYSDFYFYPNEQGISNTSIFSVECKRLPAPEAAREKEYVYGIYNNGGIERYKTEKHGKGLNDCGLLGYIEKDNPKQWLTKINKWITDIALTNKSWSADESLSEIESNVEYCFLESIALRKTDDLKLIHLWINLN
ncbi:hypothetical protein [Acidiluteibacter ferrifornacis]|uniref:Uncharacterized protein n=1 Tax=Acidiluteibacter ferrifornacis TaxID=2692424 RepID=A0A6N9NJL5_9FLAO|nr:hypothetical protein [Acidiluteibacter ferrifornacis]NBG66876.1 hypothetical protein [Acidiluteibacter ferrifornacis]